MPPAPNAQPNPVKTPVPESKEVLNTLERLRLAQKQQEAPKARTNPRQAGAPDAGGSIHGDTALMTASQMGAVGDHVRECWTRDAGAVDADKLQVLLTVTTDDQGIARRAVVADADRGKLSNPVFRAFAERAVRAVLDSRCANLPLPKAMLGQTRVLDFRFSP
jgi:hypothetical protein